MVHVTGVLWLRTRAAWRRRWPSLLAITLLVAVTIGVTLTAVAGARRTKSAPARYLRENAMGDVSVELQEVESLRGVAEIASLPQVRDVSVAAVMAAFPITRAGDYIPTAAPVDGKLGVKTMRGLLLAGRRPDPHAAGEIMLSEAHARILAAHVGDRIPLSAFDHQQAQRCLYAEHPPPACATRFRTERLSVRVVGISRTSGDVNGGSDITVSVLGGRFFQRHRAQISWSPVLSVRLRPHVSAESFAAAARRALPTGVTARFEFQNGNATFDAVDVLTTGLALFALVAGLAGGFAVGQAVVRQVRVDDEERAVLATLGATHRLLIVDALGPVGGAAILGAGFALFGAYFASASMPIGFARRVDPSRGRQLDWPVVFGCVALLASVVAGAAVAAVLSSRRRARAHQRKPGSLAALVGQTPVSAGASVGLRHACSPGRGPRSVPVRSAVVGVAAATAGIIGVLGFSAGLSHLVHTPRLYGWNFDLLGVNSDDAPRVVSDRAVAAVADVRMSLQVRVNGRPTHGWSFEPIAGDIGPALVAGRAPIARDEIALGADTMHAARAPIGATVAVAGSDGKLAMRVVGQAVFPAGTDAFPLADGAVVAPVAVDVLGSRDSFHQLAVRYRPDVDRAAAFARLAALRGESAPDESPPDRPVPPGEIEKLRQVESLPKVLAGFLALLGIIALSHALVVGVRRRARDFAVLRALGLRRSEVRAAIAWEAGALAFAGLAIGIPLGIVIARIAWARTARSIGVLVAHRVPITVALAISPAAVILAILIAVVPARRAAKLRPAEILRSE